jgi:hypothetical protein
VTAPQSSRGLQEQLDAASVAQTAPALRHTLRTPQKRLGLKYCLLAKVVEQKAQDNAAVYSIFNRYSPTEFLRALVPGARLAAAGTTAFIPLEALRCVFQGVVRGMESRKVATLFSGKHRGGNNAPGLVISLRQILPTQPPQAAQASVSSSRQKTGKEKKSRNLTEGMTGHMCVVELSITAPDLSLRLLPVLHAQFTSRVLDLAGATSAAQNKKLTDDREAAVFYKTFKQAQVPTILAKMQAYNASLLALEGELTQVKTMGTSVDKSQRMLDLIHSLRDLYVETRVPATGHQETMVLIPC